MCDAYPLSHLIELLVSPPTSASDPRDQRSGPAAASNSPALPSSHLYVRVEWATVQKNSKKSSWSLSLRVDVMGAVDKTLQARSPTFYTFSGPSQILCPRLSRNLISVEVEIKVVAMFMSRGFRGVEGVAQCQQSLYLWIQSRPD